MKIIMTQTERILINISTGKSSIIVEFIAFKKMSLITTSFKNKAK